VYTAGWDLEAEDLSSHGQKWGYRVSLTHLFTRREEGEEGKGTDLDGSAVGSASRA